MAGVTDAAERSERPQPLRRARVVVSTGVVDDDRRLTESPAWSTTDSNAEADRHLDSIGPKIRTEADPTTLEDLLQKPVATTVAPDGVGTRLA